MSKVILLTGASRGIGLAIAKHLLQNSHKVVLVARSEGPLRDLEKQFSSQVAVITGDLSDFTLPQKAVDAAQQRWHKLDGVIVNHGMLDPVKKVADSTPEEWRAAYDVNFFSAMAVAKASIPLLRQSNGTVLLTSSGAAATSYGCWGAYGSSKAAINHLAATIANEEKDIVSIAIRPGVVDTVMQQDIREKHYTTMAPTEVAKFQELSETGKLLKPEQPGHVMAKLVVNAPKELSGKFLTWDAEELKAFQG